MSMKLRRMLAIFLCLSMLAGSIPAWAEEAPAELEISDIPEITSDAQEIPEASDLQEVEILPIEDADASVLPPETAESAPEETSEPDFAPETGIPAPTPEEQIDSALADLSARLAAENFGSDYEKALWIYSMMLANISTGAGDTAYDAIVGCEADSTGYALAMQALMNAAGLECTVVSGSGSSWIIARLDGAWMHLHPYMDDLNGTFGAHFGLTDAVMAQEFQWSREDAPACTDANCCFYVYAAAYAPFSNLNELAVQITEAAAAQTENLKLYNAAALSDISECVSEILSVTIPGAEAEVSENGCLISVNFRYAAPENTQTPEPEATAAPETAAPSIDAAASPETSAEPDANGVSSFGISNLMLDDAPAVCAVTTQIVPAANSITIGVGEKLSIANWTLLPEGAQDSVTYSSKSTKVATVSADGIVTGKRAGSTTITLITSGGLKATIKVTVKKAPTSITLKGESKTMGVGQTQQLSYTLSKNSAATSVTYASSNTGVATVSESGLVTAIAPGEVTITVSTFNGKKNSATLQILAAPTALKLSELPTSMGIGQETSVTATLEPEGSYAKIAYSVVSGDAVSISASGHIVAEKSGTATVRASTHVDGVYAEHTITVLPAPKSISFAESTYTVEVGTPLQLTPTLTKGSYSAISYSVSKEGYFTIDENGVILPIQRGSATVTAATYNGLKATVKIVVVDPNYPEDMQLAETPPAYLDIGETYTPVIQITPASAQAAIEWTSSAKDVCTVDSNGKVTAVSYGQATISGVSTRNPSLSVSFKIIVLGTDICLTMPTPRSTVSGISATLTQIKAVRASAYNALERLYAEKTISKSDYNARRGYIERAFDMYLMPWMTDTYEGYWKAANSNDGLKDFKPDVVYFGLPYTQTNRRYNKTKAVNQGYFTSTSKGYYKLQGSKFTNREYPGNDCSSFVSMAIWGTDSSNSYLNTRTIATSTAYRTLSDWSDLRPGDILNKSGNHVVMFLYYANKDKTQIVIIEQGGGDDATNTVSCSIRNVSYYTDRGYSIRRVKSLGY